MRNPMKTCSYKFVKMQKPLYGNTFFHVKNTLRKSPGLTRILLGLPPRQCKQATFIKSNLHARKLEARQPRMRRARASDLPFSENTPCRSPLIQEPRAARSPAPTG